MGDSGTYQNIISVVILIIAMEASVIAEGNPYLFAVAPYTNCPEPHKGITLCTQYACSLPFSQRAQFENKQIAQLKTLGNSFGVFQCQKSSIVNFAKGASFLGAVIGFSVTGIIADNYGRRKILIILQTIGTFGFLLVLFAPDIYVVALGMFLAAAGVQSSYGIAFSVLKEVL